MRASQLLRVVGLWTLLLLSAQAADEADALPTLFDFLGAVAAGEGEGQVRGKGDWVDPLDMIALGDDAFGDGALGDDALGEDNRAVNEPPSSAKTTDSKSTPEVEVTQ